MFLHFAIKIQPGYENIEYWAVKKKKKRRKQTLPNLIGNIAQEMTFPRTEVKGICASLGITVLDLEVRHQK